MASRLRFVSSLMALAFLLVGGNVFRIQILQGDFWKEQSRRRSFSAHFLLYNRGTIFAGDSSPLALDKPVFDLVAPPGELFPLRAKLLLLWDRLKREERKEEILREKALFKLPQGLGPSKLLRLWQNARGKLFFRLIRFPGKKRIQLFRHFLPVQLTKAFHFRRKEKLAGDLSVWELWVEPEKLGIAPPRSAGEFISTLRNSPNFYRPLLNGLKSLAGLGRNSEDLKSVLEKYFFKEKEVVLFKSLPEQEAEGLRRHIALRRRYFEGIKVRPVQKGAFPLTSVQWELALRASSEETWEAFLETLRKFGSPELSGQYQKNVEKIFERYFGARDLRGEIPLIKRAERIFWKHFRSFLKERGEKVRESSLSKFSLAWELAEVYRARYLENALFSNYLPVIPDLLRFGDAGMRCLSYLSENGPFRIRVRKRRQYPGGEVFSTLVGLARERQKLPRKQRVKEGGRRDVFSMIWRASDREKCFRRIRLDRKAVFSDLELVGAQGIELVSDQALRGFLGAELRQGKERITIPPLSGQDLTLTVDPELSTVLYKSLDEVTRQLGLTTRQGFCVVVDVTTGAILSLVSFPSFDPERYLRGDQQYLEKLGELNRQNTTALVNHCFLPQIPGSVFKLVVAACALEKGLIGPSYVVYCPGLSRPKWFCRNHGPAELDLIAALERSCNAYFAKVGAEVVGAEVLDSYLESIFMDGSRRSLSLMNRELLGRRLGPKDPSLEKPRPVRFQGKPLSVQKMMSYGSGPIAILPLSLCQFVASLACEGAAPPVHILKGTACKKPRYKISKRTSRVIKKAMWKVVHSPHGTAYKIESLRRFSVAAKTGTAEVDKKTGRNNAWIVAFAPFENPRYCFLICLERVDKGVHGAEAAGPVLARVLEFLSSKEPDLLLKGK